MSNTSRAFVVQRSIDNMPCIMYGDPWSALPVTLMKKNKVIDLFAGVGGLSLGAARAGFSVAAAVEIDKHAIESHACNFPKTRHLSEDVSSLAGSRLLELAGVPKGQLDGLIGGPPCQGFSDIGLRSDVDPRNELLVRFFELVNETEPAFFLAENVPGVALPRNAGTLQRALEQVPSRYTVLPPMVVTASDYGAPTSRTRVFFYGYDPNRVGALNANDFKSSSRIDVRVRDALRALPRIRADWQSEEQSWRAVGKLGRSRFERRLTGLIPHGVGDPTAMERHKKGLVSGFLGTIHTEETVERFRFLRPGQRDAVSKSLRLDPNGYCPTLRAGTGPERGSYQAVRPVHPTSPRVISPREAARLQGFPDWFQFHPTKWHAFRQIGNSVSPMVSESLLATVAKAMT